MKTLENGKTVQIFCTYHSDELVGEYNLHKLDPELYTLAKAPDLSGNYGKIHFYINELVTQIWALSNAQPSDYIGFCHYRRLLEFKDGLKTYDPKNPITGFFPYKSSWGSFLDNQFLGFLGPDLEEYIRTKWTGSEKPKRYYLDGRDREIKYAINEIYLIPWDVFTEMIKFMKGFLDYFDLKYSLSLDPQNYYSFVLLKFIGPRLITGLTGSSSWWITENGGRNLFRVISVFFELLIGFWLGNEYESNL